MTSSTVPIVFCDTETDGVHPLRKPWEFGAIRREPDGSEREQQFFIDIDLEWADPFGLRVGGFYERHPLGMWLAGGWLGMDPDEPPEPGDPMLQFDYLLKPEAAGKIARITHGAHVVGAVPNFDTGCLDPFLRDRGLIPSWHYHLVDVENLAVGYLAGQGKPIHPPWKSDDLTEALGLDPVPEAERHTALGDARFAMRIYDHVMGGGA